MQGRLTSLSLSLAACLLAGCTSVPQDAYPSLAIRDVERVTGTLAPPPVYVPPPPPAAALDQLDALLLQARTAHDRFVERAPELAGTVQASGGASVGSEGWARSHVALAELETLRSQAMIVLADLDRIYVDAATQGQSLERVAAAREQVLAMVEEEDRRIESVAQVIAQ